MGELVETPTAEVAKAKEPSGRLDIADEQRAAAEAVLIEEDKIARRIAKHAADIAIGFITWNEWEVYTAYDSWDDSRISPEMPIGREWESGRKLLGRVFVALKFNPSTTEAEWFGGEQSTELASVKAVGVHVYSTDEAGGNRKYEISNIWDGSVRGSPQDAQDSLNTIRHIAFLESAGVTIG